MLCIYKLQSFANDNWRPWEEILRVNFKMRSIFDAAVERRTPQTLNPIQVCKARLTYGPQFVKQQKPYSLNPYP